MVILMGKGSIEAKYGLIGLKGLNSAIDTYTDVNKLYTFLYDVIPRVPETEKGFVARPIVYDSSSVNLVRRV